MTAEKANAIWAIYVYGPTHACYEDCMPVPTAVLSVHARSLELSQLFAIVIIVVQLSSRFTCNSQTAFWQVLQPVDLRDCWCVWHSIYDRHCNGHACMSAPAFCHMCLLSRPHLPSVLLAANTIPSTTGAIHPLCQGVHMRFEC